jgi:hypothetical protein
MNDDERLHRMIPLDRYREIIAFLASERDTWGDGIWLRFAAQAAVLCPEEPAVLAGHIRQLAATLCEQASWYQDLGGPTRFMIAAMLIQHHIPVDEFLAEHARASGMMRDAGLRGEGFHATMAVLILRLVPGHQPMSGADASRLKAIYDQMKRYHWWLTGPQDLPACAALAPCPGPAEMVVARAEAFYQRLGEAGLATGDHLRTAASLLTISDLPVEVAVARYRDLERCLEERIGRLYPEHYDAVALLSVLDHRPEPVIERVSGVRRELDLFQPDLEGSANFIIACDLAFLDLVRFKPDLQAFCDPTDLQAMLQRIHLFHIAAAVLVSQVDTDPAVTMAGFPGLGWPYPTI